MNLSPALVFSFSFLDFSCLMQQLEFGFFNLRSLDLWRDVKCKVLLFTLYFTLFVKLVIITRLLVSNQSFLIHLLHTASSWDKEQKYSWSCTKSSSDSTPSYFIGNHALDTTLLILSFFITTTISNIANWGWGNTNSK